MDAVSSSDASLVSKVARTISLAFANDPLIRWLRPHAQTWDTLTQEICKWQFRRIETAVLDGFVFSSNTKLTSSPSLHPTTTDSSLAPAIEQPDIPFSSEEDASAAILLFPPHNHRRWTPGRILLACKLWLFELVDTAPDPGTSRKRLDQLLEAHESGLERARSRCGREDVWYLEVLAVHPSLQGHGIGSNAMQWLIEFYGHGPIVLECTTKHNVSFYQKFGFEVIEEVQLVDETSHEKDNETTYWLMLKDGAVSHGSH